MAKPKGSKKVVCPKCGKVVYLMPGTGKTCDCGETVGAATNRADG